MGNMMFKHNYIDLKDVGKWIYWPPQVLNKKFKKVENFFSIGAEI